MEEVQLNELENYRPTSQLELCRDASLDGSEFIVKTVLDDEARPFLVIDSKTQISFEQVSFSFFFFFFLFFVIGASLIL